MNAILFDIHAHIGVLSRNGNGWTKEVNIVSWNGGEPKVDIREWDPHHERMSRGITLRGEEARKLIEILSEKEDLLDA